MYCIGIPTENLIIIYLYYVYIVLFQAGLKSDVNDSELLECAEAVTKLTTAQFSEEKAKLVIDTASNGGYQSKTLTKLAQIK